MAWCISRRQSFINRQEQASRDIFKVVIFAKTLIYITSDLIKR